MINLEQLIDVLDVNTICILAPNKLYDGSPYYELFCGNLVDFKNYDRDNAIFDYNVDCICDKGFTDLCIYVA